MNSLDMAMHRITLVISLLAVLLCITTTTTASPESSGSEGVPVATLTQLRQLISTSPYVTAVFTSNIPEYATWSNSLRLEIARTRDMISREAGARWLNTFKFVEVSEYSDAELATIIEEMGVTPHLQGHSGFTVVWRDGGARLYEGQPQATFLANWLMALETTELYRTIQGKSARKALQAKDNVRVVGYFRNLDGEKDPQFASFLRVAKRFHLDLEFVAVSDRSTANAFKLRYPGDVAILKPSEPPTVWSQFAQNQEERDGDEHEFISDDSSDEDGEVNLKLWTYETLVSFINKHRHPLWSEIAIPSMFKYWLSSKPKIVLVVPNRESLTRQEAVSLSFNHFKTLAKQYARQVGMEFLIVDASIFTQIPNAIEVPVEELPALVAFTESKKIQEHVMRLRKAPNEDQKELLNRMKNFLANYLQSAMSQSTEDSD